MTGYEERRAALEALLADARERAAKAHEECSTHYKAIEELDNARLRELTDEEILASEELRRWICGLSGREAHARYRRLQNQGLPEGLSVEGQDGRDEWYDKQLPILRVALQRRQEVGEIAQAVRQWAKVWALGRPDMILSVLEESLSAGGVWSIEWDMRTDKATVVRLRYGSREERFVSTLEPALNYVAYNAWY